MVGVAPVARLFCEHPTTWSTYRVVIWRNQPSRVKALSISMPKQSAIAVPAGYTTQELKDHYITIQVLEQYLQDNVGEFGSKWRREVRWYDNASLNSYLTNG